MLMSGIFTNWLSIYTQTRGLHKKNSLAAIGALLFFRGQQTPHPSVPRARLLNHPSPNARAVFMTPDAAISGTEGRCDRT